MQPGQGFVCSELRTLDLLRSLACNLHLGPLRFRKASPTVTALRIGFPKNRSQDKSACSALAAKALAWLHLLKDLLRSSFNKKIKSRLLRYGFKPLA